LTLSVDIDMKTCGRFSSLRLLVNTARKLGEQK